MVASTPESDGAMSHPKDVVITPESWQQQTGRLQQGSTGLLNLVGWFGSTHTLAQWRKDRQFLRVFQDNEVMGFDPQVDDWDPSYAAIEAEVLANASVMVIRLENNELLNGSLGSIAEIGLALTSAALRGQIIIISIEDNLLTTLNEPGAIAQYMMLELSLEQLEKHPQLAGFLRLHRGDDLVALAGITCQAVQQQMIAGQLRLNFDDFLAKKTRRSQNYPLRILLGGSGGAYAEVHREAFKRKKALLTAGHIKEGQIVKIVSEGAIAEAWKIPYGSIDNIGVALATRTLLAIETEFKQEADLLLLPIMSEAASKAACSEIGFLLLNALTTGQDVRVTMEPFNPVDYLRFQFKDVPLEASTMPQIRRTLHAAGVADAILATAVDQQALDAFEILTSLKQGGAPAYHTIRHSILGQTQAFHNADNVRRVRALVQAHLKRLAADERFPGFFAYAEEIVA
jgi:hypothetical protein